MFADLYGEETDRALRSRAEVGKPPEPEAPGVLDGTASAIPSGLAAGGLEVLRAGIRVIDAWTDAMVYQGTGRYLGREIPESEIMDEPPSGKAVGRMIESLTPKPEVTGAAAQVLHGFAKFGGKAAGYALTFGPAGPVLFGVDETINESARLREDGVDANTAAKAAAIHGLASAAGAALPLTGKTVAQTVGLAVGGGPVLYSTEIAGIREILENADYQAQAALLDPFDPVGLAVSTAAPLAFGAAGHAMRARTRPAAKPTPKPVEDAARVALAEQRDRVLSGADPRDARAQAEHQRGVAEAEQRINEPPVRKPEAEPPARPGEDAATVAARETAARYAEAVAARQDAPAGAAETVAAKVEAAVLAEPVMRAVAGRVARESGVPIEPAPTLSPDEVVQRLTVSRNADAAADSVLVSEAVVETPEQIPEAARQVAAAAKADPSVRSVLEVVSENRPETSEVTLRGGDGTSMAVRFVADPERAQAARERAQAPRPDAEQSGQAAQRPRERAAAPDGQGQGPGAERAATPAARGAAGQSAQSVSPQSAGTPVKATPEGLIEAARGGDDPAAMPTEPDAMVEAAVAEVVDVDPGLMVELDDGTTMTAAEALAAADEAVRQAETDSKAFEAAVSCFLRTGG